MIKKFLIFTILLFATIFVYLIFFEKTKKVEYSGRMELSANQMHVFSEDTLEIITITNKKNEAIQSFYCDNVLIKLSKNKNILKLKSKIFYEKPFNFKLEIYSFFGKELDLGSNNKLFWYWSKRDKQPGLYWSYHKDFQKTGLKTPFDPDFLKSSLGFEIVEIENVNFLENSDHIMIIKKRKNTLNQDVQYCVLINKSKRNIEGIIIKDAEDRALAACEIFYDSQDLPQEIVYKWHEENEIMSFVFINSKINYKINEKMFVLPDYSPKINMAE